MKHILVIVIGALFLAGCTVTIGSYPIQSYATAYRPYQAQTYAVPVNPANVRYYAYYQHALTRVTYVPTHVHAGAAVVRYAQNPRGYTVRVRYYGGYSGCRHAVVMY